MALAPYEDELEEADWLGETVGGEEEPWARHLRRQLGRVAIVAAILLTLAALGNAGRPGRWILARFRTAIAADFSAELAALRNSEKLRGCLVALRRWVAREWQVTGPALRSGGTPPALLLPLEDGRPFSAAEVPQRNLGLDLQAPAGSPVLAAAPGTLRAIRSESTRGGLTLVIEHADGWRTTYEGCQTALVSVGATVSARQPIALLGTWPPPVPSHLHFELWHGSTPVDPRRALWPRSAEHVDL